MTSELETEEEIKARSTSYMTFSSWLRLRRNFENPFVLRPWKRWRNCRVKAPHEDEDDVPVNAEATAETSANAQDRQLPPLPTMPSEEGGHDEEHAAILAHMEGLEPGTAFLPDDDEEHEEEKEPMQMADFSKSIEAVKNRGWYWGPISGDAAEKLLSEEPDGSFVVRDSSDQHYIFSLTFKLNGSIRHVRIEHDQGNFSFGPFTKFKSNTIVDFIENAVEHSRSGRFLFFLHRRPVLGPMRVQLLYPVSRFKNVQSLQHLCRFVILRHVPRDLLYQLPVPTKIQAYLNTPFYYAESIAQEQT